MGQRSGVAVSCGVGRRCSSDLALLWQWHRLAAVAPIWPLARTSICRGYSPKKTKTKKTISMQMRIKKHSTILIQSIVINAQCVRNLFNPRTRWTDWIVLFKSSQLEQICWISALLTFWFKVECPFSSEAGEAQSIWFLFIHGLPYNPLEKSSVPPVLCSAPCLLSLRSGSPRQPISPAQFWGMSCDKEVGKWDDLDLLPHSLISKHQKDELLFPESHIFKMLINHWS